MSGFDAMRAAMQAKRGVVSPPPAREAEQIAPVVETQNTCAIGQHSLMQGDCVEMMRTLPAESVHSIVCDPPYNLAFMGCKWDTVGTPYEFQQWTRRWAEEAKRVLKPGGYALVMGGTRTFHRTTSGLEDAGFEIRDCMMWLYGTGFPKSHNISKAIDKAAGAEREVVKSKWAERYPNGPMGSSCQFSQKGTPSSRVGEPTDTAPATEAAAQWEGWGTALKPAWEPVIVARKPLTGTVAANVLEHGVGGLAIDKCRILTNDEVKTSVGAGFGGTSLFEGGEKERRESELRDGRWPANLMLTHHPECVERGMKKVKGGGHAPKLSKGNPFGGTNDQAHEERYFKDEVVADYECHHDCPVRILDEQGSGGASRFFYCAKTRKGERNAGCDNLFWDKAGNPITREEWDGLPEKERREGNIHVTVKPIRLMEYLVRLVTPPSGIVLDPFMGSGTTLLACERLGFTGIGIEIEPESFDIAAARLTAEVSE